MDIYPGKEDTLVYEDRSAMQVIKVFDKRNGFRYLTLNGVHQGGHLPGRPERLILPYFKNIAAALVFLDHPMNYLFIGLGAGALPSYIRAVQPGSIMDVAEIDPAVVRAAEVWFGFREDAGLKVSTGDGREFVRKATRRYDAVFLDAYRDLSIPSHLLTFEFMQEVKAVLKPGGVAVSNLWGSAVNPLFNACVRTLQVSFPELYQFKSYTYNHILVADTKDHEIPPYELLARAKKVMGRMEVGFDLVDMIRRQYSRLTEYDFPAEVLHDMDGS